MDTQKKQALWKTADQLRCNMSASEYKHVVLGLIFLKYISDSFEAQRNSLTLRFADPIGNYYLSDQAEIVTELEDRDYYTADNVFWVPENARWNFLQDNAKQPTIGKLIDDALLAIEAQNPVLKNILNKIYARLEIPMSKLGDLIDTISTIGFEQDKETAKDTLGEVYEYFLGMFASEEGKRGGEFYTPPSIVRTLVEIMAPHRGKIYDPACGSGGMFIQSNKFLKAHAGDPHDISIYGQESNPTTWRLAAMNLAIRGIGFNLAKIPADTFSNDQHRDLKADFVLANPPFNISEWGQESLLQDPRWQYGIPPKGNANYAWLQHIIHHLAPTGIAGIVLANGSMSSTTSGEGDIRRALIQADLVECMVALPGQLFFNTQIPACLWFLRKQKKRRGHTLFIDARNLGALAEGERTRKEFSDADIQQIAQTYHAWRADEHAPQDSDYQDIKGFCKSASLQEISDNDFVLTPGRYVGLAEQEEGGEPFAEKMARLTGELSGSFARSNELEAEIRQRLGAIGYEI